MVDLTTIDCEHHLRVQYWMITVPNIICNMAAGVAASVQVETKPVKIRHSQQSTVQQTLVSLLPQSKTGQAAIAARLNPKKRSRDDVMAKAVGLASTLRRTRSRAVVGV